MTDLENLIAQSAAAYRAMSPIDRAIAEGRQRRSFVRGQTGHDPGPDPLIAEIARLREVVATLADMSRPDSAMSDASIRRSVYRIADAATNPR